jgi:hypothetical protein
LRSISGELQQMSKLTGQANENEELPPSTAELFEKIGTDGLTGWSNPEVFVDWIGNRWTKDFFPHIPENAPEIDIPINGDGFRAGKLEWLAFGIALQYLQISHDSTSVALELGSSQAPWCLSWLRAVEKIDSEIKTRACGVEAGLMPNQIEEFWSLQELRGKVVNEDVDISGDTFQRHFVSQDKNREFLLLKKAVTYKKQKFIYFPIVDITKDNGAALSKKNLDRDYRGVQIKNKKVEAVSFKELVKKFHKIDFLHMDLQGEDLYIVKHILFHRLANNCRVLMIGTHSKRSHSLWKMLLPFNGYFVYAQNPPVIVDGVLCQDGELVAIAKRLLKSSSLFFE